MELLGAFRLVTKPSSLRLRAGSFKPIAALVGLARAVPANRSYSTSAIVSKRASVLVVLTDRAGARRTSLGLVGSSWDVVLPRQKDQEMGVEEEFFCSAVYNRFCDLRATNKEAASFVKLYPL